MTYKRRQRSMRTFPFVVALVCVTGCNIYEVAHTDQVLGRELGVGAWMDPALAPLAGCDAVFGMWPNRGNLIRDGVTHPAVLAAVLGVADDLPETAFSEELQLSRRADGAIGIEAYSGGQLVAARTLEARRVSCLPTGVVEVHAGEARRLAVDRAGALWVGEHRFAAPADRRCGGAGVRTQSVPDGLATVVSIDGVFLLDADDPTELARVRSTALSMGVKVAPTNLYYLPGEQHMSVRVHLRALSQWQLKIPFVHIDVPARLEVCHSYLLVGGSDVGDTEDENRAWAAIVDMGADFNWRACRLTEPSRNIWFDGNVITANGGCFGNNEVQRLMKVDGRSYAQ